MLSELFIVVEGASANRTNEGANPSFCLFILQSYTAPTAHTVGVGGIDIGFWIRNLGQVVLDHFGEIF